VRDDLTKKLYVSPHAANNNKYIIVIATLIILVLNGFYLRYEWNKYQARASAEAIQLAQSLETLVPYQLIEDLVDSIDEAQQPEYLIVKNSLMRLVKTTSSIRFAYIMGEQNGNMVFLMDSESLESPDYSPPGQVFTEAQDMDWQPFLTGETLLTEPETDRWGTWISALVPIKNSENDKVIAVFGIDYPTSEWYAALWKQMIPDFLIVFIIFILYFSFVYIWVQHYRLNKLNRKLSFDEALYRNVFEQSPIGIAIMENQAPANRTEFGDMTINPTYEKILGRQKNELRNLPWAEITYKEDLAADLEMFDKFKESKINSYMMEKRFIKPDGSIIWTKMFISSLLGIYDDRSIHLCLIEDISERKKSEDQLKQSLNRTESMINNHHAIMLLIEPISGKIIEANNSAIKFYGYSKAELLKMTINDINTLDKCNIDTSRKKVFDKEQQYFTFPHQMKNGEIKIVDVYSCPIDYDEKKVLFSIIFDVTKREEITKQNEFLAYHDYLTSLYNRRFFEEEYQRRIIKSEFPVALLLGDIDGFKVLNDLFGHAVGDKILKEVAIKMKNAVDHRDVLTRIGGDEFAIIVSEKNESEIRQYLDKLEQISYSDIEYTIKDSPLTISWGYGIQRKNDDTIDMLNEQAEAYMYNRKFYSHKSARSKTVDVIMQTLFTKSDREKKHSERVGKLCEVIAKKMNISKSQIDKIRVAGLLHDIGKIGIDESILNKAGKLDVKEWELMKLHSAKGASILESTVEYQDIADVVLSHHEHYDGTGYPRGLQGESIPLWSRIIAVADAFDVMTNIRPYHAAISDAEAILELKRCSGTQFDPQIIDLFKEIIND